MFSFDRNKVNFDEELGRGASGKVYPYNKTSTDDRWIVKHVNTRDVNVLLAHMQEIIFGFSCDHPAIVPIKGYHIEQKTAVDKKIIWDLYIKQPRLQETLENRILRHIEDKKPFSEDQIIKYFYTLTCGLEYLHKKKIVHRDVKPTNIMFDKHGNIRLTDIGIGKFVAEGETSFIFADRAGTRLYCAPEILLEDVQLKKKDLFKTDAWSLGVVMAEVCLLELRPVDAKGSGDEKEAALRTKLGQLDGKVDSKVLELLLGLLQCDRTKRSTIHEVKKVLEQSFPYLLESTIEEEKEEKESAKKFESTRKEEDTTLHTEVDVYEGKTIEDLFALEANIDIIRQKFSKRWKNIFEYDTINIFPIKAIDPQRVTDDQSKEFVSNIMRVMEDVRPKVEELVMDLTNCQKLTDQGVKDLIGQFEVNIGSDLKHIELNFEKCSEITDQSVKDLTIFIGSNSDRLGYLALSFAECIKITDQSLKMLVAHTRAKLRGKIQHFSINLVGCTQVTNEAKAALRGFLDFIPEFNFTA